MSISGDLFLLSLDPSGYGRLHPVELGCALIGGELVDLAVLGRISVEGTRIRHLDRVGYADQFDNPMLRVRMDDLEDESDVNGPGPDDLLRAEASLLVDTYDGVWAESEGAGTEAELRDAVIERVVGMVADGSSEMADEVLLALAYTAKLTDHLVSKLRHHGLHKKLNDRAEQCSRFWTSSSKAGAVAGYGGLGELHSSIRCVLTAAARFAADPVSLKGPSTLGAAWAPDPRGGLPNGVLGSRGL
jgi:Golgi phosphoprotein 3 (GPP34)